MSKPVAYLHRCKDAKADNTLSFVPAHNPQWTSEPLYSAARIETLEAALNKIAWLMDGDGDVSEIARAALAPEQDK